MASTGENPRDALVDYESYMKPHEIEPKALWSEAIT
jgi:hypothetical protein